MRGKGEYDAEDKGYGAGWGGETSESSAAWGQSNRLMLPVLGCASNESLEKIVGLGTGWGKGSRLGEN